MSPKLISVVAFSALASGTAAQTCPEASIVLFGQDAVDRFPAVYVDCDRIAGNLIVRSDPDSAAVTDLSPLGSLIEIDGSFLLDPDPENPDRSNRGLTALTGLERLERVGRDLKIRGTDSLRTLAGLAGLREVGGTLELTSNRGLQRLSGLDSLRRVGGDLFIGFSPELSDLAGLGSLDSIGGDLNLQLLNGLGALSGADRLRAVGGDLKLFSHPRLASVAGLGRLNSVGGHLRIADCDALPALDGLSSLTTVGDGLSLSDLPSLVDLDGLASLTDVGGPLTVRETALLTSLEGLAAVDAASISQLTLDDNPALETCTLRNLCAFAVEAPVDSLSITGGVGPCGSTQDFVAECRRVVPTDDVNDDDAGLTLYPNPSRGDLYVDADAAGGLSVAVYDARGRAVARLEVSGGRLDLRSLPAGLYALTFAFDAGGQRPAQRLVQLAD